MLQEAPTPVLGERPLSTGSNTSSGSKRKSYEGDEIGDSENNENAVANKAHTADPTLASAKKLKFKDALVQGDPTPVPPSPASASVLAPSETKRVTRSALPRYSKQAPATTNIREAVRAASATNRSASTTRARGKTATATVSQENSATPVAKKAQSSTTPVAPRTSERLAINTSSSSSSFAVPPLTPSSNNNAILRRLRAFITKQPNNEVIRNNFDSGFSVAADKVAGICSNLKVKSKWDYKEKATKQDAVIKELRQFINTFFGELKSLRENCLIHESHTNNLVKDVYDDYQEIFQEALALRGNESKMKNELERVQEDLEATSETMQKIKTDFSPLRHRANDFEKQNQELTAQLAEMEAKSQALEIEYQHTTAELTTLRTQHEDLIKSQNELFELKFNQSVAAYKDEIAQLKADLKSRQNDTDRLNGERSDMESKKSELYQEAITAQSRVREMEGALARSEKELERMTVELDKVREQVNIKDADLRTTFGSLGEIQRQASEEKAALKAELTVIQGRVQLLEEERLHSAATFAEKKEEAASASRELVALRETVAATEARLQLKEQEMNANRESLLQLEVEKELRGRAENREWEERRERIAAVAQLMATQTECAMKVRAVEEKNDGQITSLNATITELTTKLEAAVEEAHKQADIATGFSSQVAELKMAVEHAGQNSEAVGKLAVITGELEVARKRIKEMSEFQETHGVMEKSRIAEYEEKIRAGENQRRKLHNLIQELRGNIRVFARVRPFLPGDGYDLTNIEKMPESSITSRTDTNSIRIYRAPRTAEERAEDHNFNFDKVFGPTTTQEAVFTEVSEFVQSALDGYNVCLFSYGQTGSGKTHSMQGSGTGHMRGIIPRAMQQVGVYKTELEAKGWEYQMEVSFIEIYNETIRDLLRTGKDGCEDGKHEIKKDAQGNVTVTDIEMLNVDPNNTEQIDGIMEQAARHRSVGQTQMNERSSRSHSVFALHLHATHKEQGIVLKGTLSLVDLAGSERLDRSGATGAQLKETVAINKSLSALTDVFAAIGNKQPHIPFRNSKLTFLLQPALSGDGKTLMMVNLSPTEESFYESLCSLRLAKQVNQCELGKPKRQLKESNSFKETASSSSSSSSNNNKLLTDGAAAGASGGLTASLNSALNTASTPAKDKLTSSLGSNKRSASALRSATAGNPRLASAKKAAIPTQKK